MLYRSVIEMLEKRVGNTGLKRCLVKKFLFNFSCVQLLLDSAAR